MTRCYFYKLTADNNGAPCVDKDGELLSLAICKPRIRSTAEPGNLIFGFAANSLHCNNRLLYIAQITGKESNGDYFIKSEFAHREDCIYEWKNARFMWRKDARHHSPDDLVHDIGEYPDYRKANVLLSKDFRYFGKDGSDEYKQHFPLIKQAVEMLGKGHRVNHSAELRNQLQQLKDWVWKRTQAGGGGKLSGTPHHSVCHRTRSCGTC